MKRSVCLQCHSTPRAMMECKCASARVRGGHAAHCSAGHFTDCVCMDSIIARSSSPKSWLAIRIAKTKAWCVSAPASQDSAYRGVCIVLHGCELRTLTRKRNLLCQSWSTAEPGQAARPKAGSSFNCMASCHQGAGYPVRRLFWQKPMGRHAVLLAGRVEGLGQVPSARCSTNNHLA